MQIFTGRIGEIETCGDYYTECCNPEPLEGRSVGILAYSLLFFCCLFKAFHIPQFDRLRMTRCYVMFQKTSPRISVSPILSG